MTVSRREFMTAASGAAVAAAAGTAIAAAPSALLRDHDALGLAALVRRGEISAAELLELAIAQAEALNPRFNFMAQRHYEHAKAAIAQGLPDGPFRGVPWLLKDLNTYIAGEVTGQGSRYYAGSRATVTSELVRRYQRAGLVIFGKTTTPELGLAATTEAKATGATRNPWNVEHSVGGSSGGAAAAVAAGVLPAAHATDGGGSLRIPASCCGLFGLKPSRGRVPMGPLRTEGWGGLSVHHAVTHTVRDSAALLDAVHGAEPGSRYAAPTPERPFLEEVGRPPGRLRIAFAVTPGASGSVDPECAAAVHAAARLCEGLGHDVVEAAPRLPDIGGAAGALIPAYVATELEDRRAATGIIPGPYVLESGTLAIYQMGLKVSGIDLARANNALQALAVAVAQFMETFDLVLTPTVAAPPPRIGVLDPSQPDVGRYYLAAGSFTPFTGLQNQTGQPSMSVPLGTSKAGLPIGVMFSARYGDEATLFRLAGQLEQAAPWKGRRPRFA